MSNKRYVPRARRRLPLVLQGARAFTADLSPGGFCVELMRALPPGATVHGALEFAGERYDFTGQVAWARAGDPRLSVRSRIGIRFTGIANAFFAACAGLFAPA
jgi:hypothetical protein